MATKVTRKEAEKWVGKSIVAYKKDGSVVSGKLVKVSGGRLYVRQNPGKKVKTKAIIPLVLFDLLAIGASPYAYGGGYGGYGPYGGYSPYGYGPGPYGGGFW